MGYSYRLQLLKLWSSLWSSFHGPLTAVLAHIFAVVVLSAILLPVLMYPLYCIHITHPVDTHCQFTLSWSLVLLTLDKKLCITMIMIRIVRITLKAPARTNGNITAGGVLLQVLSTPMHSPFPLCVASIQQFLHYLK